MKKQYLMAWVFALLLGTGAMAQNNVTPSPNANHAIGVATGAINSTCENAGGPGMQANLVQVGECPGSGQYYVSFYRPNPCPPNAEGCIQVIVPIGTVRLDCDFNVETVTCGPFIIPVE